MSRQLAETVKANPNLLPKTIRTEEIRVGTSGVCGKFIPVKAIPLLREDRASGMCTINLKLDELSERLINPILVRAYAYLVPKLAAERFQDMGSINRSYSGETEMDGTTVIPWFKTMPFSDTNEIFKTMGLHAATGDQVNDEYVEAYNIIWNYRAEKRSRDLTARTALDSTLAPALWPASEMAGILSSFDQAQIDAEVPINFLNSDIKVRGFGRHVTNSDTISNGNVLETEGVNDDTNVTVTYDNLVNVGGASNLYIRTDSEGVPMPYAEMVDGNLTMSMSLMEMAKKAAQQAHVKEKYKDIPLDHIVNLLMEGINVPEELMNRPILLDRVESLFGYSTRYATDSGNLEKSVTEGMTSIDLKCFTPQINSGGVIMICLEVVPERVFERQMDHYFLATSRDDVPNNLADYLDPEKVSIVKNKEIDVQHATPDATFGYRPLNSEWDRDIPNLGGKFYRNDPAALPNENRNRIWASEVQNPTLTEDWYLATTLNDNPFVVQGVDHLEISADGSFGIVGLTQKGKRLVEDSDSYDEILDLVDQESIDQNPPA
jgi:hypothetical protein